jgi:hypothetical protein
MRRKPHLITTPFPTPEEVARIRGVSRRRTKQLVRMAKETLASRRFQAMSTSAAPTNCDQLPPESVTLRRRGTMKPHLITTPFVTPERAAEILGVSPRRTKQLVRMAKETLAARRLHAMSTVASADSNPQPVARNAKPRKRKQQSAANR